MLTADVQEHIRTAHDAFDERIRAENKAKEIAQRLKSQAASSSRPPLVMPSAIYQTSQPQARGPTLSATRLAHFNKGAPQDEDDDTKSLLSGVSISPSDSPSVASTRVPIKAAYRLDLKSITEEVKPIDLWRASTGQPPASSEMPPERSSGGSGSQDSESEPNPDHVLQFDTQHGAVRRRHEPSAGSRQPRKAQRSEPQRFPDPPPKPDRPKTPPLPDRPTPKEAAPYARSKSAGPAHSPRHAKDARCSPSRRSGSSGSFPHPDLADIRRKFPLEDDGAQVLEDSDNMSSFSRASSSLSERSGGGTVYRLPSDNMIIASRRLGEPFLDRESIVGYMQRCKICNFNIFCASMTALRMKPLA